MSFDSLSDFLAMGGHGLYVWLSYGAALVVVLANVLSVRNARKRSWRQARALSRRLASESQSVGTPGAQRDQTPMASGDGP